MKVCPQCNTQYSDDTLKFCLQDGTPLTAPPDQGAPTLVINEPEVPTDPRGKRVDVPLPRSSGNMPPGAYSSDMNGPARRGSRLPLVIAAAVLGTLLLVGLGAIGAWVYFSGRQNETANSSVKTSTPTRNTNAVYAQPSPSAEKTAASTPTSEPTRNIDEKQIREEVSQRLRDWRSQTEDLDIDAYMDHYAPRVDYYNKSGASSAAVRADKQRAFSRYDAIEMNISDLSVTTDPSGETATAVFDKEWNFSGENNSQGKVRQMLKFRNFDGEWLITAEKDLKVYYTR